MPARITHDVVATIGEYTDRETGQKKKRYHTCGKCLTDAEGRQSIKLDAIPGPGWSGWLSLYPVQKTQGGQPPDPRPASRQAPAAGGDEDDDIPF